MAIKTYLDEVICRQGIEPKDLPKFIKNMSTQGEAANLFLSEFSKSPNQDNYIIASEFGRELYRADLDVPCSFLAKEGRYYIQFPEGLPFSKEWKAAFVIITEGIYGCLLVGHLDQYPRSLFAHAIFNTRHHKTAAKALDFLQSTTEKGHLFGKDTSEAAIFAAVAILYIRSGDPDLRHLKAPAPPTTKKEKKQRQFKRNNSLFDATMVGFDWKKPPIYHQDETYVRGHFKWQRCGRLLCDVKLIWINAHIRHFDTMLQSA